MEKLNLIFDGNEKQVFSTEDPEMVVFRFKDTLTAYNSVKRAVFRGKGKINATVSSMIFRYLSENGVKSHFVERISDRELLCRKVESIPLEFIVRNVGAGTMATRLGLEDGTKLGNVVFSLKYNNDELGDPVISRSEATALGIITCEEATRIHAILEKTNNLLIAFFARAGLDLIDMKLEFGKTSDSEIILCDEISPDTCRIWDSKTKERFDKDRFRLDLGEILASYETVCNRLSEIEQ